MQQNLPLISSIKPPALLDEALIEKCVNFKQALAVSMGLARTNAADASIAGAVGVMACVWSRIKNQPKNRPAYLSGDSYTALCYALGNLGVLQWLALRVGMRLVPIAESREQRLERELAELRAKAA